MMLWIRWSLSVADFRGLCLTDRKSVVTETICCSFLESKGIATIEVCSCYSLQVSTAFRAFRYYQVYLAAFVFQIFSNALV